MGKSSAPTIGYWYRLAAHFGITPRMINGVLGIRGGDKDAWKGSLTASGTIHVDAPNLWGGEKDQGGIVGDFDVMFGDADQVPNPYLVSTFGDQTATWRGVTTIAFTGGRYGAMNPYPQKPSFKFWRTTAGWDLAGGCWYPEKAGIPYAAPGSSSEFVLYSDLAMEGDIYIGPPTSPGTYIEIGGFDPSDELVLRVVDGTYTAWSRWPADSGNGGRSWTCGVWVTKDDGSTAPYLDDASYPPAYYFPTAADAHAFAIAQPEGVFTGSTYYRLHFADWVVNLNRGGLSLEVRRRGQFGLAANPAHVLYESLTAADMGREPVENINDASFRAAADKLYAEGFGICPKWDPSQESVEDFQKRIGKLIGGSINRSLADGQWYLDLARGDYVLDDLPIVGDDDILSFKEAPTTLDDAINSVSVKYYDPEKVTGTITPPVRSLALVTSFGTIHQTYEYPEIPTGDLAARVAQREMLATSTPTRAFDLACKPTVYALRPNQYFRLQAPKRGIADMVCLVGEIEHGSLKSGAIKLKAVQDVYSMPASSFVQVEPGVDTRPPQTPNAIVDERAIEAPYVEVAGALPRSELEALPADAGFAMAMAAAPAGELDFTVMVDAGAGAGYADQGTGHWCATATVNESASRTATSFTLANAKLLGNVTVGMGVLWDDEIVRVDAIDADALTIALGRGCADTTPQLHAANSRLFFYEVGFGYDSTEYTDGETIDLKLLSRTGSQLLALGSATPMEIEFNQRQARPYPPAKLRINSAAEPGYLFGELTVEWVHRDRLLQADQLVDTEAATIGPEAGTTYTMRTYVDNVLDDTQTGISGTSATVSPSGDGTVRIEVEAVRDALVSWQAQVREFSYTAVEHEPLLLAGEVVTILGEPVYME